MDQDGNVEIWDFTITDPPKRFPVDPPPDGEVFEPPPVIGGRTMVALVKGARSIQKNLLDGNEDALMTGIEQLFGGSPEVPGLLTEESGPRFIARINDLKRPVDLRRQILPILQKLMEAYGLRPTQEPTDSSSTPASDGTSSTDGAPAEASTPSASTPDASST